MYKFLFFLNLIILSHSFFNRKKKGDLFLTCDISSYTKATKNCQVGNLLIKEKAENLTNDTLNTKEKAEKIFSFVRDKITYQKYSNTKFGAVESLKRGIGNACDKSHLLIALLRAVGIPAQYQYGKQISFHLVNYHVWVIAFIDEKWVTLDPSSENNEYDKMNNGFQVVHFKNYKELPF